MAILVTVGLLIHISHQSLGHKLVIWIHRTYRCWTWLSNSSLWLLSKKCRMFIVIILIPLVIKHSDGNWPIHRWYTYWTWRFDDLFNSYVNKINMPKGNQFFYVNQILNLDIFWCLVSGDRGTWLWVKSKTLTCKPSYALKCVITFQMAIYGYIDRGKQLIQMIQRVPKLSIENKTNKQAKSYKCN